MRTEYDSMGAVKVPKHAYYGAQTQRAIENFPISGKTMPAEFIHALGLVKWAAAKANADLGLFQSCCFPLNKKQIAALQTACFEVASGQFDDQFPVDVYQTGSGTSTNMNANEVIACRANELAECENIRPNDHVNMGQSTNDIFPTAIHIAVITLLWRRLHPAVADAAEVINEKAKQWRRVLKIGRTHLADATPMTLGQEFSGFAHQLSKISASFYSHCYSVLVSLPVGGTAVGTGINTHSEFPRRVAHWLSEKSKLNYDSSKSKLTFGASENYFASNAQRDQLVLAHSFVKSLAVTLMNIANNIRWLGSGPRSGFYEVIIPDLQPGSSIMPGKVNPVLCEALMQACARVIGNDTTITTCGAVGGQFQLNVMMPVMADAVIESVNILSGALEVFTEKCLKGLEPNEEKCREGVERSLSMAAALNPYIGYERAAAIAKEAFKTGKTVREVCLEKEVLPPEELKKILDPMKMTRHSVPTPKGKE